MADAPGTGGGRRAGDDARADGEGPAGDGGEPSFEEGRYVYCAVTTEDGPADFTAEGLDGERARLVATADGDVGAVVQPTDAVFDSEDPATVKRWLLDHQRVVDAAGEAFGTPLPFRFDTILRGGDEAVRSWLASERAALAAGLDAVAGQWEYRVGLRVDEAGAADELEERDDRLGDLAAEIEAASEGAAFLKEKQYEKRRRELRREREAALLADLESRLADLATEVRRPESSGAGGALGGEAPDGPRLTLLAPEAREGDVGEALEAVAAEPGVEVRFTGPWPPYSFTPSLGEDGEAAEETQGGAPEAPGEGGGAP